MTSAHSALWNARVNQRRRSGRLGWRALSALSAAFAWAGSVAAQPAPATENEAQPSANTAAEQAQGVPATPTPAQDSPAMEPALPGPLALEPSVQAPPPEPQLSEAELSQLIGDDESQALTSDDPSLKFYGFADFTSTFNRTYNGIGARTEAYGKPTFYVGNINLYADANLTGGWRSLFEIRFLYLPQGSDALTGGERFSTLASDYVEIGRPLMWGGIEIERAWLQYTAHSLLTIRVGQWLTPYGIWNVDHGSPTIIPVQRPYVIGEALFPERQTGIQLLGDRTLGAVGVGYHLTLSNGRGSVDAYKDLDTNKAVGGRLYLTATPLGQLTVGVSGYLGRSTDSTNRLTAGARGAQFEEVLSNQFDEMAYGMDLLWQWGGLHVQGELVAQDVAYTDAGRPEPLAGLGTAPGSRVPDFRYKGGYGLVAYRLPWLALMPYALVGVIDSGRLVSPPSGSYLAGNALELRFGLNVRPVATITLKGEYQFVNLNGPLALFIDKFHIFNLQAAWSF